MMTVEQNLPLTENELETRSKKLMALIRATSPRWSAQNGYGAAAGGVRALQAVLGRRQVVFVTGKPWIEEQHEKSDGKLLVYTDDIIVCADFRIVDGDSQIPTLSITIVSRRNLQSLGFSEVEFSEYLPARLWPDDAEVVLDYEGLGTVILPIRDAGYKPPSSVLEGLVRLLPSLLDDLSK